MWECALAPVHKTTLAAIQAVGYFFKQETKVRLDYYNLQIPNHTEAEWNSHIPFTITSWLILFVLPHNPTAASRRMSSTQWQQCFLHCDTLQWILKNRSLDHLHHPGYLIHAVGEHSNITLQNTPPQQEVSVGLAALCSKPSTKADKLAYRFMEGQFFLLSMRSHHNLIFNSAIEQAMSFVWAPTEW